MDETGLHIGITGNGRVLGSSATRRTFIKTPGASREWVTTIEAISAAGHTIQPLVIFKGKSLQSTWFESDSVPDWIYTVLANAFTTNIIGLKWLKEVFLPFTARDPPRRRVLIMDNQASHIATEFLFECYQNNVYAFFLLPHTSHACQPLDVCPFSQLKL
jgi:DDE superfamily endonuclease